MKCGDNYENGNRRKWIWPGRTSASRHNSHSRCHGRYWNRIHRYWAAFCSFSVALYVNNIYSITLKARVLVFQVRLRSNVIQKCPNTERCLYRMFILQAYYTSRTSYRQTLVYPGKLKVIHSVISWSVSQSVLRHWVWQKLLLCPVLCLHA
jgi:hypothetical protein